MESYMGSSLCLVCRTKLPPAVPPHASEGVVQLPLCKVCREARPQQTLLALRSKLRKAEKKARDIWDVCRSCASLTQGDGEVKCDSRDCPVFYSRVKTDTQLSVVRGGVGRVLGVFEEEVASKDGLDW